MSLADALIAQTAGGGDGGIDPVIFMFIVGGLAATVTTLAGILWRRVEAENKVLREKLAKYEDLAPQLLDAVESMRLRSLHEPTSASGGTRSPRAARLPYPYRSPRSPSRGVRTPRS